MVTNKKRENKTGQVVNDCCTGNCKLLLNLLGTSIIYLNNRCQHRKVGFAF